MNFMGKENTKPILPYKYQYQVIVKIANWDGISFQSVQVKIKSFDFQCW